MPRKTLTPTTFQCTLNDADPYSYDYSMDLVPDHKWGLISVRCNQRLDGVCSASGLKQVGSIQLTAKQARSMAAKLNQFVDELDDSIGEYHAND